MSRATEKMQDTQKTRKVANKTQIGFVRVKLL